MVTLNTIEGNQNLFQSYNIRVNVLYIDIKALSTWTKIVSRLPSEVTSAK